MHKLPGPMWLAPYVLDYLFGVESDEEKEVVRIVHNSLHEILNWLNKDIDTPASLLAYAEEIELRRLVITHGSLERLRRGMDVDLDGESLCEVCIYSIN